MPTGTTGSGSPAGDDERPDPIRAAASRVSTVAEEPSPEAVSKGAGDAAATGALKAGGSGIDEIRRHGILGLVHVLGPGLITGASDDDPSGIGTYSQAGSQFGLGTLWLAIFTFPLMLAVQEACARIALQTGVGLGTSLRRRFPPVLVGACILLLLCANTINVGADLGAVAAGGSMLTGSHLSPGWFVVPIALLIGVMQLKLTYSIIFRCFKYLTLVLFAYVITVVIVHPNVLSTVEATFIPHVELNKEFLGIVVAILGTTISPYLFFWQASSEVDEMKAAGASSEEERQGTSRKELRAARIDVSVGMLFSQIVMYSIILTSGTVLHSHGHAGIETAQQAAEALKPLAGPLAFLLFAVGMIGTGTPGDPRAHGKRRVRGEGVLRIPWWVERDAEVSTDILRHHRDRACRWCADERRQHQPHPGACGDGDHQWRRRAADPRADRDPRSRSPGHGRPSQREGQHRVGLACNSRDGRRRSAVARHLDLMVSETR